jgi:ribosomal protein L37E
MNFDKLTICPRCGGDANYVEEVNENLSTQFCFSCGFQTNSLMKEGENFYEEQINILPELYKDLLNKDGDGHVWMPTTINVPDKGMVFANGPSKEDWGWAAVKAVPVTEEEKEKYPIPGKKDQYYEWRMAMDTIQMFPEREFMEALSYIGLLPE